MNTWQLNARARILIYGVYIVITEIADHESELIQKRRNSNVAQGIGGHHVTNFLASQTLGLCFLAVPQSTAIK